MKIHYEIITNRCNDTIFTFPLFSNLFASYLLMPFIIRVIETIWFYEGIYNSGLDWIS